MKCSLPKGSAFKRNQQMFQQLPLGEIWDVLVFLDISGSPVLFFSLTDTESSQQTGPLFSIEHHTATICTFTALA